MFLKYTTKSLESIQLLISQLVGKHFSKKNKIKRIFLCGRLFKKWYIFVKEIGSIQRCQICQQQSLIATIKAKYEIQFCYSFWKELRFLKKKKKKAKLHSLWDLGEQLEEQKFHRLLGLTIRKLTTKKWNFTQKIILWIKEKCVFRKSMQTNRVSIEENLIIKLG